MFVVSFFIIAARRPTIPKLVFIPVNRVGMFILKYGIAEARISFLGRGGRGDAWDLELAFRVVFLLTVLPEPFTLLAYPI